jgi:hypothetical protein
MREAECNLMLIGHGKCTEPAVVYRMQEDGCAARCWVHWFIFSKEKVLEEDDLLLKK